MKLELSGHRFSLTFEGMEHSREFGWGEYDSFLVTRCQWSGAGVLQALDSNAVCTFSFDTSYGFGRTSLKAAVFNTQLALSWGQSIDELLVLDEGKIVDWMAEKILGTKGEETVRIPELDRTELVRIGAITDSEGQAHLGI